MYKLISALSILIWFISIYLFIFISSAQAYQTDQTADIVVGQSNFTSSNAAATQNGLNNPSSVSSNNNLLVIADSGNNRILIYNNIPSSSGNNANLVIGQTNFTSNLPGTTRNTIRLSLEGGATTDGSHLFVADRGNNRILIWNSIPSTTGTSADIVLGQSSSFTTSNSGCKLNTLNGPNNVFVANGKLFVTDTLNNRVLIYNSIPTSSNTNPDLVVGKPNFTDCAVNTTRNRIAKVSGAYSDGTHLILADKDNNRVLIWNSIPLVSGQNADIVLGQPDFTSNTANNGGISASSLFTPTDIYSDGTKLFVTDNGNNRILVWNSIPSINNKPADTVLGQPDALTSTPNTDGVMTDSLNSPRGVFASSNQLFIADQGNNRTLIYNIPFSPPILTADEPVDNGNGLITISGSVNINNYYIARSVEYSVNGGSFYGATATDGTFDEATEAYNFSFNPQTTKTNSSTDYTVLIRAANDVSQTSSNWFYFQPFLINNPEDGDKIDPATVQFTFNVNNQRALLINNLTKYQIWIKDGGTSSTTQWRLLVDNIPVDFSLVQKNKNNLQQQNYLNSDPLNGNGIYEDQNMIVNYSNNSSTINVLPKGIKLRGTYSFKITATDLSGHQNQSDIRTLIASSNDPITSNANQNFPLAVTYISGLGKVNLSSLDLNNFQTEYNISSNNPIISGIAYSGSVINLTIDEIDCIVSKLISCSNSFTTTANNNSQFGINLPSGSFESGKSYNLTLSANLDTKYNELPPFTLTLANLTDKSPNKVLGVTNVTIPNTPTPTINKLDIISNNNEDKNSNTKNICFLGMCITPQNLFKLKIF